MRREVPIWVAVLVVVLVIVVVAVVWRQRAQQQVQEPPAPFLKEQPAGPEALPGQAPVMPKR